MASAKYRLTGTRSLKQNTIRFVRFDTYIDGIRRYVHACIAKHVRISFRCFHARRPVPQNVKSKLTGPGSRSKIDFCQNRRPECTADDRQTL